MDRETLEQMNKRHDREWKEMQERHAFMFLTLILVIASLLVGGGLGAWLVMR